MLAVSRHAAGNDASMCYIKYGEKLLGVNMQQVSFV